jgi:hypothetical protein
MVESWNFAAASALDGISVPVTLIIVGAVFAAAALGIRLIWTSSTPHSGWIRAAAFVVGMGLIGTGIYLESSPPGGSPARDNSAATTPSPTGSTSPSQPPQPATGPLCEMVTVSANLYTRTSPPLSVGAKVAVTGPDIHAGDGRIMWIFSEDGSEWYPLIHRIDRTGGTFRAEGLPLGRIDHPEDASARIRYFHIALLSATQDDALRSDLQSKYHPLNELPQGATELFVVPLRRVCTPA